MTQDGETVRYKDQEYEGDQNMEEVKGQVLNRYNLEIVLRKMKTIIPEVEGEVNSEEDVKFGEPE